MVDTMPGGSTEIHVLAVGILGQILPILRLHRGQLMQMPMHKPGTSGTRRLIKHMAHAVAGLAALLDMQVQGKTLRTPTVQEYSRARTSAGQFLRQSTVQGFQTLMPMNNKMPMILVSPIKGLHNAQTVVMQ